MHPQSMGKRLLVAAFLPAPCLALRAEESAVQSLIAQLSDEDYETRVAAEKQLTELGDAAREALKALQTDDPEVRVRAARVLIATATCENVATLEEAAALRSRLIGEFVSTASAGDAEAGERARARMEAAWKRIEELAPAADRNLKLADLRLEAGVALYGACRWSRRSAKIAELAHAELGAAVDAYEDFLKSHPGREDIEERQQRAQQYQYGSRKMYVIECGHEIKQR
ncbi:MAG: hypothetical protein L6R28_20755 [Planctomycetes bacterium]|nr:hypothetical protein [Planctomycetota bacterium]